MRQEFGRRLVHVVHVVDLDAAACRAPRPRGIGPRSRAASRGGCSPPAIRLRVSPRSRHRTRPRAAAATARGRAPWSPPPRGSAPRWPRRALSRPNPSISRSSSRHTTYGIDDVYASQVACSLLNPAAASRSASSSRVLPIPASPMTSIRRPAPERALVNALRITPSSALRPVSGSRCCVTCRVARAFGGARPTTPARARPCPSPRMARAWSSRTACWNGPARRRSRRSLPAPRLRLRHQPCREVHRVAHDRVRASVGRTDVAGEHGATVHADVDRKRQAALHDRAQREQHALLVVAGDLRRAGGQDQLAAVDVDVGGEERDVLRLGGALDDRQQLLKRARPRLSFPWVSISASVPP